MKDRKVIMVLFGGESSEHQISRRSAVSVLQHINREKYEVRTVGITRTGDWFLTDAGLSAIYDGTWEKEEGNAPLTLALEKGSPGFFYEKDERRIPLSVDVVFPVLHGKNGEDGTVQGLLDMAGIPYVGSGAKSSAACMDKALTKALVEQSDAARQAKSCILYYSEDLDLNEAEEGVITFFRDEYPLFVKPASAGSSVGISKIHSREELKQGLRIAFAEDSKIIVEKAVSGRELEIAVLGNEDPLATRPGEILSANEFYDYEAKYEDRGSKTTIPEDLPSELVEEMRTTAVRIFRIMECQDLARVDFFLDDDGRLVFNEINTMPGFTSISMYPMLWEAEGLAFGDLVQRLIQLALEKQSIML